MRYFISVAEYLSFSKAATYLFIGQPGLSQGIANLENYLGVKLFDRDRHSVCLTVAGKVFLKEAIEIVNQFDKAVNKVRQTNSNCVANLDIGFLPSLGKLQLPQWISNFHREYPLVNLNIKQHTMATLHIALEEGALDIGYTRSFGLKESNEYIFRKVSADNVSVVLRKDYPLSSQNPIDLSTFANESFALISQKEAPQWHRFAAQIFEKRGLCPKIIAPGRIEGIYTLVEAGLAVGLVPSSNRTTDFKDICFVDIKGEDAKFYTGFAWKASNKNTAVTLFMNYVFHPACDHQVLSFISTQ